MRRLTLTAIMIAATVTAHAGDLTADQIIEKANLAAYYSGKDGKAKVKMTIVDKNGGKRVREFAILRLNDKKGGDQKFYVYFTAPADVRKMAYLVWKKVDAGKDDDRWLWLPAMNLVKRIAPGDKRTSFVGSDFVYEDVSGRSTKADKHELIKSDGDLYQIRNTPKEAGVKFKYYDVWINKKTFLPMKAEYFDANDKKYRTVEATKVDTVQGHATVLESKVTDLERGGHTINSFSDVKYDVGLKERIFTERFLRRPPREVK
jgi:hypothetical protein